MWKNYFVENMDFLTVFYQYYRSLGPNNLAPKSGSIRYETLKYTVDERRLPECYMKGKTEHMDIDISSFIFTD